MRVALDENLSPKLARALAALFEGEHEVIHIRLRFGAGLRDVQWISELSGQGRWSIVSADRRITKVKAERQAFLSSNLVGFFMSAGLSKAPVIRQMERLLALWPVIEQQEKLVEGGAMFELPGTTNRLKQLKL